MDFHDDKERLIWMYRTMYTIRVFESRCIELYRQALIRGYFHPYLGQEAIAVGVCAALNPQDYITSTHRGHGHCIARGADLNQMTAELFGKQTGYCAGRGGSMHIADMSAGNLGANGVVAAGVPHAAGAALGAKIRKEDCAAVAFTSDGAVMNGVLTEALGLAAGWNAPMILVIENNQYAVSTPIESVSRTDLVKRGEALGVHSVQIDGNDVMKVYQAADDARRRCSNQKGPVLIEAITYRHGGHHCNDPGKYMPEDKVKYYKTHDPLLLCEEKIREINGCPADDITVIQSEIERAMEEAVKFATGSPEPSVQEFLNEIATY